MDFTPVLAQRTNAYQAIVDQVETAITEGGLAPGDRLPGERQLMADFGVSRATVREALRVLQAHGLVESRPGDPRGPVITRYPPRLLQESLARLALSQGADRIEILQFRLVLAGHAAQLAASARTDDDLRKIQYAADDLAAANATETGHVAAAITRFHSAVNQAAHNQFIEVCGNAVAGVLQSLMATRLASDRDAAARLQRSIKDSRALLHAIRDRDSEDAFRRAVDNIHRYYEDDLTEEEQRGLSPILTDL